MPVSIGGNQAAAPVATAGALPSFLKTGDAAQEAFKQQEQARAAAQEAFGRMWRFYITTKELGVPFRITFLDGMINPTTKMLGNPSWRDHSVKNARGFYDNYVCTDHGGPGAEPCPICQNAAADKPSVVMGFTIIDHRPVEFKKGEKAGKTEPFSRKLLIAKSKTLPLLQVKAAKFGGLRGISMDVMRTTATDASVGNVFELHEQYTEEELQETFGANAAPANWDFELNYKTADELIKQGIAPPMAGVAQSGVSQDYTQGM